jgi:hypothetical protein
MAVIVMETHIEVETARLFIFTEKYNNWQQVCAVVFV